MVISLFGTLVRFVRETQEQGSYSAISKKLELTEQDIKDFENNINHPTNDIIKKFSNTYDVPESNLNFFIFHEYEPKKLSLKFRKFACVMISKLMYKYLDIKY